MRNGQSSRVFVLAITVGICSVIGEARSQVYIRRIADLSTSIPDRGEDFSDLSPAPVMWDGRVLFTGYGSAGYEGIFEHSAGVLTTVVDTTVAVPGGLSNFARFGRPYVHGERCSFPALDQDGHDGLYMLSDSTLTTIADATTLIPNGVGVFRDFVSPIDIHAHAVAFSAFGEGQRGLYLSLGSQLRRIVDRSADLPGGAGDFASAWSVSVEEDAVAFIAQDASAFDGVYLYNDGNVNVLADEDTPPPQGTGLMQFRGFWTVALDGPTVILMGVDDYGGSVYLSYELGSSDPWEVILRGDARLPNGTETLRGIGQFSYHRGNIAFEGYLEPSPNFGIFALHEGSLVEVIRTGDLLDGRSVDWLGFGEQMLWGNDLAVYVSFEQNQFDGIYVATIAQPGSGDYDSNGGVDLYDFRFFQACHASSGPDGHAGVECRFADFDGDGDVDSADVGSLQIHFNGVGR